MVERNFEKLARPLPWWHPKAWYFGAVRLLLNTLGRLSHGIRIGHRYGFDSGVMLDHVYTNRARGITLLGRVIDRVYLNSAGWRGIRNRGRLVTARVVASLRDCAHKDGRPVRLADLACGGGQYVLDALADARDIPIDAVLRDYREENVERTIINAEARHVSARVEQADAFSDDDLATLGTRDIVIVSGLHEIIPDDGLIEHHFRQIAEVLSPGGHLLVTVQPDHPQLELIARTLKSHTGRPWTMRLRHTELIVSWAGAAGFSLLDCEMEATGIFGVVRFRRD